MPGIYIHIPFCRRACHYCNFHFSVSQRQKDAFLDALLKEITIQADFFKCLDGESGINTLYIGGGTPSMLDTSEITKIFHHLAEVFPLTELEEFTLEANPDDLTYEKLLSLRDTPVNRLSIGIQSFQYNDLHYMNRLHTTGQAVESLKNALRLGFDKLTVDLIYGTPGMNDRMWKENLQRVVEMGIRHISAYALTVEEKTVLHYLIKHGKAEAVSDAQSARQFEIMCKILEDAGYDHYEISNFALSGHYSKHNMSYWTGDPYLGLGPSAHSFRGRIRSWNVANTAAYIASLEKGELPSEEESLSSEQAYNEYVMTALRTMWGCDLIHIQDKFGEHFVREIQKNARKHLQNGMLEMRKHHLIVTPKGKFFADGIASDLFAG